MESQSRYHPHRLNETGVEKTIEIASLFHQLEKHLTRFCPSSREFSLVITKLQEAKMWAVLAISQSTENQE